jgi:hypothetical protein
VIYTLNFILEIFWQEFIILNNILPTSPKNSQVIFKLFFDWLKHNFRKFLGSIILLNLYFNFLLKKVLVIIIIFNKFQSFILFCLFIYFHSIQQNILPLSNFFKQGNLILEILNMQQWALVIIPQSLKQNFSSIKQISFQVHLIVCGNNPEINHCWMQLQNIWYHTI